MDESTARSRHPDAIRTAFLWALLPSLVLFLIAPAVGDAQVTVTTSITSTPGAGDLGTTVTQAGNLYNITGGTRPGNGPNLFHSFGDFSVGTVEGVPDIANFLNNTGLQTSNILSRVTGGNISNIYGTIQTNGIGGFGNANLFLLNPSGIVFGPNGSVNVGGSVSFTTAQYLRLFDEVTGNSANFYANPANDGLANSVLAVAPLVEFGFLSPAAYGFLTAPVPNATITVQGSELSVSPSLPDSPGHSISLVGGDVIIQGGARLSAPNGNILLTSAATPGEFDVATLQPLPNVNGTSFTSFGSVSLLSGSSIDVSGANTVFIKGGQLVLSVNDATLSTSENPVENPAPAETVLLSQGSSIVTSNSGTDSGADVQLIASDVHLVDGSFIITQTSGPGRGGDVRLTADSLTLESRSLIFTTNSGLGVVGGDLFLNVGTLNLLGGQFGGSLIGSINSTGADLDEDGVVDVTGAGGNVTVQGTTQGANSAADSVVLSGGSRITSDAGSTSGNGGGISIRATSLDLDEASIISSSTAGTGHGGDIVVSVQQLRVVGDAIISSSTSSENLIPAASGMVTVQGLAGPESMASSVRLSGPNTGIVSDSSSGVPGDITVHAGTLTITNGAAIAAGSPTSTGPGGTVTVTADSVVISADGKASSLSFAKASGKVTITATNALTLDNGSIDTNTSSESGNPGGDVELNGGTVSLTNGARINSQSETFSTGPAGNITITGKSLTLANHSEITSSSKGTVANAGDAGNITIHSASTFMIENSKVTTEAAEASGGQIEINAPEMVRLTNSEISTSVAGSATDTAGGNITIDPQFVILQNSQIIAQANAGSGGTINIVAGVFVADPASIVDASAKSGNSGTVSIQSPVQNLGEQLTPLSQQFSSAAALLAQRCAARVADGKFSTFVVAGREGLPTEPGGFLASPSLTAELFGSNLSAQYPHRLIAAVAGSFPEYEAKPIQLAKYGDACR